MKEAYIPVEVLEAEIFRVTSLENRGCLSCSRVEYRGMYGEAFVGVIDIEDFPGEFREEPRFFAQYDKEDNSVNVYVVTNGEIGAYIDKFYLFV